MITYALKLKKTTDNATAL